MFLSDEQRAELARLAANRDDVTAADLTACAEGFASELSARYGSGPVTAAQITQAVFDLVEEAGRLYPDIMVERDASDPNRLNISLPPELAAALGAL